MAERATLARPYAKAAFSYAHEHHEFDAWSKALQTAAAIVSDRHVAALLSSPRIGTEQILELLSVGSDGSFAGHFQNFLRLLVKNRRPVLLPEIAAQFEALRAELENTVDVSVTSAVPLDAAQLAKLVAALRKRLNREVKVTTAVDADLVGGAIIRAGDLVIDGSLRGRLERLRTELGN